MLTQHNRKTARLSPDYTFAIRELGVWSGDETTPTTDHFTPRCACARGVTRKTVVYCQFHLRLKIREKFRAHVQKNSKNSGLLLSRES